MSAQHTPGPWSLETVPTSAGSCHKIGPFPGSAPHRREVHACVYADGVRIGRDESLPAAQELLANARLIAAAPELLACAMRSAASLRSAGIEPDAHSDNPLCWLLHQTEAAIAKATGEQA